MEGLRVQRRVVSHFVLVLTLGILSAGCSTLNISKVESEAAPTRGGVRYTLRSPVWQLRIKETQGGQVPKPDNVTRMFDIDAEPIYIPDQRHTYEVTLSPGLFTSDSLKVKLDEYGALSRVAATSEPQFAEFVKFSASVAGILLRGPGVRMDTKAKREAIEDSEVKRLEDVQGKLEAAIKAQADQLSTKPTKEGSESLEILQGELARVRVQIAERKAALAAANQGEDVTKAILLEPLVCDGQPDFEKHVKENLQELKKTRRQPVLVVVRRSDVRREDAARECKWWREVSK